MSNGNVVSVSHVDRENISDAEPFLKPVLHDSGTPSRKSTNATSHRTRFDESIFIINVEPNSEETKLQRSDGNADVEGDKEQSDDQSTAPTSIPDQPAVSATEVDYAGILL